MKKSFLQSLVMIMVIAVAVAACSKYPGFKKTDSGLFYKIEKVGTDTVKPKTGDWVTLEYRLMGVAKGKDTLILDSKGNGQPPIRLQLPVSDYQGDIYEGMKMMSKGDSAIFIVNADSLFVKTFKQAERPKFLDTNSVVKFSVRMVEIEDPIALKTKEEEGLKSYVQANNITVSPLSTGLYYIETKAGKGTKIDTGSFVKLHFTVKLIDGKEVFSSKTRPEPLSFQYGQRFDTPGLEQAISMMTKGSVATVIVPSTMAFGEQGRGNFVPAFSTLIYDVEIIDVQTKEAYDKEQSQKTKEVEKGKDNAMKNESIDRQNYLKKNNINAKPTISGLIYLEKAAGTGQQAASGKKVTLHYTGTLLNGKKFDSSRDRNKPFEFTLGKGEVIKGWDEGVAMMKKGGRATFIIPSDIAYGSAEMGDIPAHSTLVFDVELIDVK